MTDEFSAYKSDPTPDNLVRLLRAHQDRVYRLCLQVLRRPHDAEDAAQEALIRIAQGARTIEGVDAFRRWTYRVALNSALEAARKSARRRAHEARIPMKEPPPAPLDDESRRALFEAVERLDDRARGVLLDHYVEGETLESIGAREGVTPQAVSKRLERAREDLRKALPVTLLGMVDLGRYFDRGATAPPPDLVSGPVLAKVAAIASGVAMSAKTMFLPGAIAAALVLCLGAGIVAMNFRPTMVADRFVPNAEPKGVTEVGFDPAAKRDPPSRAFYSDDSTSNREAALIPDSPMRIRLNRFRDWWVAKEKAGFGEDPGRNKHDKELWSQVSGLRGLILAEPDEFLKFLRDRDNEGLLMDLTQMNPLTQTDRPYSSELTPFDQYPQALREGLFDLLQTGTPRQRVATFRLLDGFPEIPDAFENVYLASVDDPNPDVQAFAIRAVGLTIPISPALHSKLSALGTGSESAGVRQAVVGVMASTPGAASETYLLNLLETETDSAALFSAIFSLERRYANRGDQPMQEEAMARAASVVVARSQDVRWCRLLNAASYLPGDRLKPILSQIMAKTTDLEFRSRLQKAIEMIERGETTQNELMKTLDLPR